LERQFGRDALLRVRACARHLAYDNLLVPRRISSRLRPDRIVCVRLDNERRKNDRKRPDAKDAACPIGESQYGALVGGGVLGGLEVLFVLRRCIARQRSAEADGGYDEVLHGFFVAPMESASTYTVSLRRRLELNS
jgi:hypothetical protein